MIYIQKNSNLKKENQTHTSVSFLELQLDINNNKFHTKLFDKWDVFPFHTVMRVTTHSNELVNRLKQLVRGISTKRATVSILKQAFFKIIKWHQI